MIVRITVSFFGEPHDDIWDLEIDDGQTPDAIEDEVRDAVLHEGHYEGDEREITGFDWEIVP